jgi:hypothetical protein
VDVLSYFVFYHPKKDKIQIEIEKENKMKQKTRRILSIIFNLDHTFRNFPFGEMVKLRRDRPYEREYVKDNRR